MANRDSPTAERPFRHLNRLLKAQRQQVQHPRPSVARAPAKSESPVEGETSDRALFLAAMADVVPLRWKNQRPIPNQDLPQAIDRSDDDPTEGHHHLSRLIATGHGFHVSLTPEYMEGIGPPAPPDLTTRLHNGFFSIQDHIDLHGLTADEAKTCLFDFLHQCTRQSKRTVLVIHGRGLTSPKNPVLKEKIADWLFCNKWRKWVIAFTSARWVDGGAGATYVMLRRTPLTKRACRRPIVYYHPE